MRDKGFTPTQQNQIDAIVRRAVAGALAERHGPAPVRDSDPGTIYFSGQLDARKLLGNINTEMARMIPSPAEIPRLIWGWMRTGKMDVYGRS